MRSAPGVGLRFNATRRSWLLGPLALVAVDAGAADWKFTPKLDVDAIHSDNIRQAPAQDELSGAAISIQPGFILSRDARNIQAEVEYTMANLLFDRGNDDDTRHQLLADGKVDIIRDRLSIEGQASFDQELVDSRTDFGADLFSNPDAFSDVYAIKLAPEFRTDLGDYADFVARYEHELIRHDRGAADSDSDRLLLDFVSGRRFGQFEWQLNYDRRAIRRSDIDDESEPFRGTIDDSDRESLFGQVAYPLNEQWALAARAGYENNDIPQADREVEDGAFWSIGTIWSPSRFIEASAFYGPRDNEVSLRLSPTSRTTLAVTRRDREVGVDTGVNWSGELLHRSQFATWEGRYIEETVSGSDLVLEDSALPTLDEQGNVTQVQQQGLTLTNSDFMRRRFDAGMTFERARTSVALGGFYEKRSFFGAGQGDESSYGATAEWVRDISRRTAATLGAEWERVRFSDQEEEDLWSLEAAVAHTFARDFSAGLAYRYARRSAGLPEDDFTENRLTALLRLKF